MRLPPASSRRWFLRGSAAAFVAAACTPSGVGTDGTDQTDDTDEPELPPCPDPLEGGTMLGLVPFLGEDDQAVGNREGEELNGRLAFDHSVLDQDSLLVATQDFFIRTMAPASLPGSSGWTIEVLGLAVATSLAVSDLLDDVEDQGVVLLECSGNQSNRHFGLISAARWSGVPIDAVFDRVDIDEAATLVEIGGYDLHTVPSPSKPGCSWVFSMDDLRDAGAFFATHMNGEPLTVDHGAPIRLIVPGWYGCCCAKWVDTVRFVDDSVASTSQMLEFASRTHQTGRPALAVDYRPARQQLSAMAIRVERWDVDGIVYYRIVGMVWGGDELVQTLQLRADASDEWTDVEICPEQTTVRTWTLWQVVWQPKRSGVHVLQMRAPDNASQRLEMGWYDRAIDVPN